MKVGKTQKRIMTKLVSDQMDFIDSGEVMSDGETLNNKASTILIYRYLPYFVKSGEGMPDLFMEDLDGIPIEKCSPLWIANKLEPDVVATLFEEGIKANRLQEDEKKN